jgi:hypothetical protein
VIRGGKPACVAGGSFAWGRRGVFLMSGNNNNAWLMIVRCLERC